MLISEFARAAGLSQDTVRFYVKRGLIRPETGRQGGSNPYQVFGPAHVEAARLIRLAQSLGFTLREIEAITRELHAAGVSRKRRVAILEERVAELDAKAAEIARMATYIRAKIAWMEAGEKGTAPALDPGDGQEPIDCVIDVAILRPPTAPRRAARRN